MCFTTGVSKGATELKCETGIIGTIKNAGVENAGLELSAPNCRGGKCGTKRLWKAKTPTCYGSHNMIYVIICHLQCSVCFYISCVYVCVFFISVLLYYTL